MNSPTEEIKSRLDIVELVGSYIRLQRAGSNFKALCPFHKEKTPSFNVSPTRQIWHCFGCGKGGDHFKFVMEIEGLDFPEALRMLAKRAGVELKREDPRVQSERNRLYDILEEATRYFQKNLLGVTPVKAYLKKRGVAEKTVEHFKVGFSFDAWDGLLRHMRQIGFKDSEIEKAGLAVRGESGSWYDRFRSRIIFPVADSSGRVVGFGGRILEGGGVAGKGGGPAGQAGEPPAKYINTPQTLVYDKSRVLYAFDKAKDSIRKANSCVIVEGYMDAILSHQAGVTNAVAVSGTALTPFQLQTLRRLADTLVSSFDRDTAGEAATKRSLDLAAEFDFERKAAVLPKGVKDPADLVLADPKIWEKTVEEAVPIVQFYLQEALDAYNPETSEGAKAIAAKVLPEIRTLTNEVERAHWVKKLSHALGVSEESVWQELAKTKKEGMGYVYAEPEGEAIFVKSRRENLEELSLGSLVLFANLRSNFSDTPADIFMKDIHRDLFKKMVERQDTVSLSDELKSYVNNLAFRAEVFLEETEDKESEVHSIFRELRAEHLKYQRDLLTRKIVEAERTGNEAQVADLAREYKGICDKLYVLPFINKAD